MPRSSRPILPLLTVLGLLGFWFWRHYSNSASDFRRVPSGLDQQSRALETLDGCPLEGDASNPAVRQLNRYKNRTAIPDPQELDSSVTLAAMLEPGDDRSRWNDHRAAEIIGYVSEVKVGGVETVNCRASDPQHRDTHIEIVLDPINAGGNHRVIVEITPRMRTIAAQRGEDWSTGAIRDHFHGRWVRVRGWLLFDTEHEHESFNTAPRHPRNWRATAWEIHPVTSLEVTTRSP